MPPRVPHTLLLISLLTLTLNLQPFETDRTIHIKPDGSIDPPTAPVQREGNSYTLKDDIDSSIEVQRNDTVLDGNGYALQGNGTGTGVYSYNTENVTMKNIRIRGFSQGIHLRYSSGSAIINNTITNCTYGILPDYSPSNTIINNTIIDNRWDGIFMTASPSSTIINNTITNHSKWGIYLGYSPNSILKNNVMKGNGYNFGVSVDYIHNIDTSNTVDGKPIYYWVNQRDKQIPRDAGYVAAVNSVNITIRNLDLTSNGQGLILVNSSHNLIENSNITYNAYYGIYLIGSDHNTIRNNNIANNHWGGIALISSTHNTIVNNNIENHDKGISLKDSNGNTIYNNNFVNNTHNVFRADSPNFIILDPTLMAIGITLITAAALACFRVYRRRHKLRPR